MSAAHDTFALRLGDRSLALGRTPVVMGILNVTPDSFSDGGDSFDHVAAIANARDMVEAGADIVDIGGESTRPGAEEVPVQTELDRVIPIIEKLVAGDLGVPLSIDTYKALVADQALQSGAAIINDVWGLQREPEIADVAALHDVPVVAMHWDPDRDRTRDLVAEMKRFFHKTIAIAEKAGVRADQLVLDPGFGFAKSFAENYELLRRLGELGELGYPILVGMSRKSMLGKLLDVSPKERVAGTVATSVIAYLGGAHIFRVHDVRENRDALRVAQAALYGPPSPPEG